MTNPNYERIITGLESCRDLRCSICPYYTKRSDHCPMFDDAIKLIQEQREELRKIHRPRKVALREVIKA